MRFDIMRFGMRGLAPFIMLLIAGCAQAPAFSSVAATLPPVQPGEARMFFYRWHEPYESTVFSAVYLNGQKQGYSQNGAVFYRDVPAGTYHISVFSRAVIPFQFKTVTVAPGQNLYVHIEPFPAWDRYGSRESFVVAIADPASGAQEIADLPLIAG